LQLPGARLVQERGSHALRQHGTLDGTAVGFALAHGVGEGGFFHGQRVPADTLMVGRVDELDLTLPDAHQLIGLVVDATLLSDLWQRLYGKPWSAWLDHQLVVPARAGLAAPLRATHLGLMDRVAAQPGLLADPLAQRRLRDAVLVEWLEAIPERVDLGALKTSAARRRVVQRACDRALARPDQPPTLLQLCRDVGASPRKLDYCFRDVLGLSPARYLRLARLNAVRRAIRQTPAAQAGVHDLAARWGFWHAGAFAADYRRQFGERPSETVRLPG
jgi:AraC family transcriptional regulator, ethanolamine operon transcriptional activator